MPILPAFANFTNAVRNFHFSDLTPLMCVKAAIFIFGKFSLILALVFANKLGDLFSEEYSFRAPTTSPALPNEGNPTMGQLGVSRQLTDYKGVLSDQLFNLNRPTPALNQTAIPASALNLSLIAVNQSSDGVSFAIIEDNTKKTQDVFGLNETVFAQGVIKTIQNDGVKIERNGKLEFLALKDPTPALGSLDNAPESDQTDFNISDEEVSAALANLPQLMTQARAVPYFRNGKSIGLRMFAIQMGSIYQKLGLKNGDILLSINDNDLSDPTKALTLFEQLKSERSLNVKLEREARSLDMRYTIR